MVIPEDSGGIETARGDGQSWVIILTGRRRSLYSKTWRRTLDPNQFPMHWVTGFISGGKAVRAW